MTDNSVADALSRLKTGGSDSFVQTQGVRTNTLLDSFVTLNQVRAKAPSGVEWLIARYFARGAITELVGPPKHGKSTLMFWWIERLSRGEPIFGYPAAPPTPVVVLTEQGYNSLLEIADRVGEIPENVHFLTRHSAIGARFEDVIDAACKVVKRVGAGMLVVDTLSPWAGFRGDAENSAGAVLEAFQPLQTAAAQNIAVAIVRHERKGGGAVGESGRGSSAGTGEVDISLQLRKPEGNHPDNVRAINALSRFDETPPALIIEWNDQDTEFVLRGTESAYKGKQAKDLAMDYLPTTSGNAIKADDLWKLINESGPGKVARTSLRTALSQLIESGFVSKHGAGTKGEGFTYWRSDQSRIDSSLLSVGVPTNESSSAQVEHAANGKPRDSFVQTTPLKGTDESVPLVTRLPEVITELSDPAPETGVIQ